MSTFESLRSRGARIYRVPGRVNLIGEHTDYNDGFVMPAAIDLYTRVAIKPRGDRTLRIHSENYSESCEFDLDEPAPIARGHWSDYVCGVAVILEHAGYRLRGADLAISSDVPIGAGLSSSAAIEVAAGLAVLENSGIEIDRVELAKLCRQAENEFVGIRCGIMDQFISCCGRAGTALMLDCRSLEYRLLPIPGHVRLVICNTMVKHELAASEYNTRRVECEAAVRYFAERLPVVRALRDVTLDDLARLDGELSDALMRRCRHVISENARVAEAANAFEVGDLEVLGRLMAESHCSLRDDYQVSCEELDVMIELASQVEGVYGSRMTGGGFGGCTINLVNADRVAQFEESITRGYQQATGISPQIIVCSAAGGARRISRAQTKRLTLEE